jgi:2-oxoisovalerate dehydrogenase E1 component
MVAELRTIVREKALTAPSDCQRPAPSPLLNPRLEQALRIRAFEFKLVDLFQAGRLAGTIHTCVGQELCATALHPHLIKGVDVFFATHRGHGHYLAYGGPESRLFAELMGREGAVCGGAGGTQNIRYERFFSSGIQGGHAPLAVGYAWALKRRGENAVAVCQIGDGTLGEGTLYEAFTFAAWLKAPVLFLLECNGWAQSTDVRRTTPGDLLQRAAGFGLDAHWARDDEPEALHEHLGGVVSKVRRGQPFLQIIQTRRLLPHSKGDDNRPPELIRSLWDQDPLARLLEDNEAARATYRAAEADLAEVAAEVWQRPALASPPAGALPPSTRVLASSDIRADGPGDARYGRVVEELNAALHDLMGEDHRVVLIGEDLLDPYGGAFKVCRGLSTDFPDRVLSTPIAEAAIVGVSNGMALAGLRPVAEIMFADFATLAADQLINFAAKFHAMYGGGATCPVTVRLVSGGRRGYGPTHSQSLERLFCGVAGLRVLALSQRHDPGRLLRCAVLEDDGPKVFVENKVLYTLRPARTPPADLDLTTGQTAQGHYPPLCYQPAHGRRPDVTVVTYGGMTPVVESAMTELLIGHELSFDYIVLTQLWPLDVAAVVESVRRTGRLVVVEEIEPVFGVSSAVIAGVAQELPRGFACRAVGARPVPIPAVRHLEDDVLSSVDSVVQAVLQIL